MAFRSSNPVFKEGNFREKMRNGEGAEAIHAPSTADLDRMYGAPSAQPGQQPPQPPQGYQAPQGNQPPQPPMGYQPQQGYQQPDYAAGDLSVQHGHGGQGERMVMGDVLNKMTILLGLIVASGAVAWFIVMGTVRGAMSGAGIGALGGAIIPMVVIAAIGAFVIAMINQFKRVTSPALSVIYAVLEGFVLGAISAIAEVAYPGIALQAVLGTILVFAVTLGLYRSGKYRTSPRMTRIVMVAAMAYLAFSLVNLGVVVFAGTSMRTGVFGMLIGLFAVLLATYFLVMDFEFIQGAIEQGAPKHVAWTAAFGLTVTLVWIYIEVLRLLMIIREMVDR